MREELEMFNNKDTNIEPKKRHEEIIVVFYQKNQQMHC
jgi:hypothetical protein